MPFDNTPDDRTDNQILTLYYNGQYHLLTFDERIRLNYLKIDENIIQKKVNQYK